MALLLARSTQIDVATAGTEVNVRTTVTRVRYALFVADPDNAGALFIGNNVASLGSVSSTTGIQLNPGDMVEIQADGADLIDLSSFWVDSATNGDDLHVFWLTE